MLKKIKAGQVPILLMSPDQSLFTGKWKDVLSSDIYQKYVTALVIDEANCVEQW